MGGFFEPEFEIGTGDEVCIDVATDLGGRARKYEKVDGGKDWAGFRVSGEAMAVVG